MYVHVHTHKMLGKVGVTMRVIVWTNSVEHASKAREGFWLLLMLLEMVKTRLYSLQICILVP